MNSNIILGIDPGFDRIGWAIGQKQNGKIVISACDCIVTKRAETLPERYQAIEHELNQIIEQHHPTELAIEKLFFARNTTTALQVSEARGVILSCAIRHGLVIEEHHPNTIKLTVTGVGNADKTAVEKMVRLQVTLPPIKLIDDTIDAIAAVMTHLIIQR